MFIAAAIPFWMMGAGLMFFSIVGIRHLFDHAATLDENTEILCTLGVMLPAAGTFLLIAAKIAS